MKDPARIGENLSPEKVLKIDSRNRVVYRMPDSGSRKVILKGKWGFNADYDLVFTSANNKLIVKGEVVSVKADSFVFEAQYYDERGFLHLRLFILKGSWQLDEYNRIIFLVKKEKLPDTLTFSGSWQLNKNQQICYLYEKTILKRKKKALRALTFEGFWQINTRDRLTYILSGSSDSRFDFRAQLESNNLYPQDGRIKYRLGIGLRQDRAYKEKAIVLYGVWKSGRDLGLNFNMDYGKSGVRAIEFGVELAGGKADSIALSLRNKSKEPLGITLILSHKFMKKLDARAYLKLIKIGQEKAVEAGLNIPF